MVSYEIIQAGRWGCILPIPVGKLKIMLDKKMSYQRLGSEFMPDPTWGLVKLYKAEKGLFPWGFKVLVYEIMTAWQAYSGESFTMDLKRGDTSNLVFIDKSLRYYQQDAVKAILENDGGIISCPTGGGKSRCAIEVINQLMVPTAIIVHTLDLKTQWMQLTASMPNVTVLTYQSIKNYQQLEMYKLVVTDESHHVASRMLYKAAMASKNAMCLGISATPFREDGNGMKIEAALGRVVYSISRKRLIDEGFLVPAKVYYHSIGKSDYKFWENYQEAYNKYIVHNDERNNKIVELIKLEYDKGNQVLVLFAQIEHMDVIKNLISDIPVNDLIYINGQIPRRVRQLSMLAMLNRKKYVALSSPVFDEGVDIPRCNVLVLAAGGKSSIKITQRIGRILRTDIGKFTATMHDFKDSCRWLDEHYEQRREILSQDFEVVDV